ncbi:hypothetical protein KKC36_00345 [Patescibacteria group bacterium]|nr:hypothetical protein [Patescibacteria group bacterium]
MPDFKKYLRGFIDPLSLIAIGFLVVSLIVGTVVVTNKGANFDIRKLAFTQTCSGGVCKSTDKLSGYTCNIDSECIEKSSGTPYCCKSASTPSTPTPSTPTRTPIPCAKEGQSCTTRSCCDSNNYICTDEGGLSYPVCVKKGSIPTLKPTPIPTPTTSSCQKDGLFCLANGMCCSGYCNLSNRTCQSQSTPIPTPIPTAALSSCETKLGGTCMDGGCPSGYTNKGRYVEGCSNKYCCVPLSCTTVNKVPTSSKPCCDGLVKASTPYGYYCAESKTCTKKQECRTESGSSYIYICNNGYWTKTKMCDFGCDGDNCRTTTPQGDIICKAGETRCYKDRLQTCLNDSSGWSGQYCQYGCDWDTQTKCKNPILACSNNINCPSGWFCNGDIVPGTAGTSFQTRYCTQQQETVTGTVSCDTDSDCPQGKKCMTYKQFGTVYNNAGGTQFGAGLAGLATNSSGNTPERKCITPEEGKSLDELANIQLAIGAALLAAGVAPAIPVLTATLPTVPAWLSTTLGWGGVAAGSYACITNPNSDACMAYIASLQGDPTQLFQLAGSTDNLINNYLNTQIDDMFSWTSSLGSGYKPNFSNEFTIADQMIRIGPSSAASSAADDALELTDEGYNLLQAIAETTNKALKYHAEPGLVPADVGINSLEDLLQCGGGQCRHLSQFSTGLANQAKMGVNADFASFRISNVDKTIGHAITIVKNSNGSFGVIDATNNVSFSDIGQYIVWLKNKGWEVITNITGSSYFWNAYQVLIP